MNILQSFRMAFRSIVSNKLRSFLTMLGIIIGVASVIVLVSIGKGSTEAVTQRISSLGTNLITVNLRGDNLTLKEEDVDSFTELNTIEDVAPYVQGYVTAKNGTNNTSVQLIGATEAYSSVKDIKPQSGRFISDIDVETRNKVVVIGSETATTLFSFLDPVGQEMQIDGVTYKVIGVLESKGTSTSTGGDNLIITPFSTAQRALQSTDIQNVYIQAKSEDTIDQAVIEVKTILNRLFPEKSDYYNVSNQKDLMSTLNEVAGTMTAMLGGIASISLIVGGIGIMNIMLVSVSERTKEIGIRKAIGAKRKNILFQFLIEAVVLSGLGGIIGVGLGIGIGRLIANLTSITVATSIPVMAIAFGFSILVGVVFGVFPANKASKLHPIQALRFD